jgi:hypothetical protein
MNPGEERLPPPIPSEAAAAAGVAMGREERNGGGDSERGGGSDSGRDARGGGSGKMWDEAANEALMQLYVDSGLHALPMNKRGSGPLGTKRQRWRAVTDGMEDWYDRGVLFKEEEKKKKEGRAERERFYRYTPFWGAFVFSLGSHPHFVLSTFCACCESPLVYLNASRRRHGPSFLRPKGGAVHFFDS